jgi:uncharacterized damage-inducible protein DinB
MVRPVVNDRDGLLTFLDHQRNVLRIAAYGLTDEEGKTRSTASAFSLDSLLRHVTDVERTWAAIAGGRGREPAADADTLAEVLEEYDRAIAETDAVIAAAADMDRPVSKPPGTRWASPDVEGWSVRWVLLHLIQETARHAGHADIIRESIDGATAFSLMAAAEDWAPRRTIVPWSRAPKLPS